MAITACLANASFISVFGVAWITMENVQEQFIWGEYNETMLHPVSFLFFVISSYFLMKCDKKFLIVPFVVIAVFINPAQRLVIGPFDFTMMRLLLISGALRVVLRSDVHRIEWRNVDYAIVSFILFSAIAYIILWPNMASVVYQLGVIFDALLLFFVLRVYLRSLDQIIVLMQILAWICIVSAILMTLEQFTQHNLFSVLGGVSETTIG